MFRERKSASLTAPAIALLLSSIVGVAPAIAEPHRYQGRTVARVLDGLQDASLQFLYSTDLVPDTLLVGDEPHTRDRLGIAREVLAEHGLELEAVRATLYIVVRLREQRVHRLQGRVVDAQ